MNTGGRRENFNFVIKNVVCSAQFHGRRFLFHWLGVFLGFLVIGLVFLLRV